LFPIILSIGRNKAKILFAYSLRLSVFACDFSFLVPVRPAYVGFMKICALEIYFASPNQEIRSNSSNGAEQVMPGSVCLHRLETRVVTLARKMVLLSVGRGRRV